MLAWVRFLAAGSLDVLSPPRCAACSERVARATIFCPLCARTLIRSSSPDAVFVYGGALANAIRAFKYSSRPDLAAPLGDLLARRARAFEGDVDIVAPVPLHPRRLAERGYNQASLLAATVARRLRVAFEPRLLSRVKHTPRQAELDRAARASNLGGAFAVRAACRGARVLLVDDVRTTGATLAACETALREAGAARVARLVLAEALLGG